MSDKTPHIIIVGGGLVGALAANFMSQRGFYVSLYEYRDDIRTHNLARGRSINLAISNRGRQALAYVGLEEIVLKNAIPMKGRLLHDLCGKTKSIPYDPYTNQCIYSVGRNFLNNILITALGKSPLVKMYFNHKLISVNIENETATFLNLKTNETLTCSADLIIGADGAFSTLRRSIQQVPLFQYNQTYIEHGYVELTIAPGKGDGMIPNHLHIWPRGEFMMIALPNKDRSWTLTLFMPFSKFEEIQTEHCLLKFFKATFPDSIPLITEDCLIKDFFRIKPSPLVCIKCSPFHVGGRFLLIGDAAHAIVPFYGQGMNAGFEDCFVLNQILDEYNNNFAMSIKVFSEVRKDDVHAICDLALYNYEEMRDLVTRWSYYSRRIIDGMLYKLFPSLWIPLYNSVTFTHLGYNECIKNREWQDQIIFKVMWFILISLFFIIFLYYY